MKKLFILLLLFTQGLKAERRPHKCDIAIDEMPYQAPPIDYSSPNYIQFTIQAEIPIATSQSFEWAKHYDAGMQKYFYQNLRELAHSDPVWASRMTYSVEHRCQLINFLNGPFFSHQAQPPSKLPKHFRENFGPVGWMEWPWTYSPESQKYAADFAKHLKSHNIHSEDLIKQHARAQMRRWAHYRYEGFQEYLKTLPGYDDYIPEIAAQLEHDQAFKNLVSHAAPDAVDYIQQEVIRIAEKKSAQLALEQEVKIALEKEKVAQELFTVQAETLQPHVSEWQKTHPIRYQAYNQTVASNGKKFAQDYYLSPQVAPFLQHLTGSYDNYVQLHGNALQHALTREIIAGVETLSTIKRPDDTSMVQIAFDSSLEAFDEAWRANNLGNYVSAAQLVDLGYVFSGYCLTAIEGATIGAFQGMAGTVDTVLNPVQAFNDLIDVLVKFGPPMLPDGDTFAELERYEQQCERVLYNRGVAVKVAKDQWHKLSNVERVHTIAKSGANIIFGSLSMHFVVKFANNVKKLAKNEIVKCGKAVLDKMPKGELAKTAPGYLVARQARDLSRVRACGKKMGYGPTIIEEVIIGAEKQGMELEALAKTLEKEYAEIQKLSQHIEKLKPKLSPEKPVSQYKKIESVKEWEKIDKITHEGYEKIRSSNNDIRRIAKNTGIREDIIARVKNHLFVKEHVLDGGIKRFGPNKDIMDTWNKLVDGKFTAFDLEIIPHEYYESILMDIGKLEYTVAHAQTLRLFPWEV